MNKIYFDCETCPLPESEIAGMVPEFSAPSNYKDATKIAESISQQRREWVDKAALSPLTGGVCAIGLIFNANETGAVIYQKSEMNEKSIIESFWETFVGFYERSQFIGFNCAKFDLPFLVKRSWKLGIPIPLGVREGRYWGDSFLDLMEVYQLGNRQEYISLDTLAKFLGVGEKSGNGKDFHKLSPEEQRKYLAHDLELTKLCAEKMIL